LRLVKKFTIPAGGKMKRMYVEIKTRIIMEMPNHLTPEEVISEMDYDFQSRTDGVTFIDTEIRDHSLTRRPEFIQGA
jgi:hypothetical protein